MKPRVFLPAVVSAVLLWAAFFPLNLGPLAFVALVPWLTLVRAPVGHCRRYSAAYLGGVVFFTLATQWVRVAHPMMYLSWLGLALVMPLFWLGALVIIRALDRRGLPLALAVPVGWVALEYARMHFPTGFPFLALVGAYQMIGFGWYFLGYTQHEFLPLAQIADCGGVYAVSWVVAAINGALTDMALRSDAVRKWLRWPTAADDAARATEDSTEPQSHQPGSRPALTVALPQRPPRWVVNGSLVGSVVLLLASVAYGTMRLAHAPFAAGPRVAAIQGNVPQGEKMARGGTLQQQYSRVFAAAYRLTPDLIIWPETCYWEDWFERAAGINPDEVPPRVRRLIDEADWQFRRRWSVAILYGLNGHEWDGEKLWKYNSALLVGPDIPEPLRYDKMHLVPFGEYVPLGEQLPFMKIFTPYKHDYSCRPGQRWTRFPLRTPTGSSFTFGCLICYEDSDTYLARQYVAREPVDFLVNISNDGWFDGTEEHEQHLAICRFRAIETRRAVVRSVNMGISAVIDPDGRVIAWPHPVDSHGRLSDHQPTPWSGSKSMEGVVLAQVPIDTRVSYYAAWGDWVPALCWALALGGGLVGGVNRFRPK
ncbi:MAG: apolipoprotein N-acyltransferase [Gemmataceae bacterium]|nr:apolipoprotein N-acyltransferase [Gemmata sp.]MDW8197672.1 apolipoprotein N-acyltransferase [Gemmataceae bacterium]